MGKAAAKKRQKKAIEAAQSDGQGPTTSKNGCIIPGLLYLGTVETAADTSFLRSQGINHIISIGRSPKKIHEFIDTPTGPRPLIYHRFALTDSVTADIKPCVHNTCAIIDKADGAGERVFVHCVAAISRSPMVVAAYLMRHRGHTLAESLGVISQAREVISPNLGFLTQLSLMEEEIFGERKTNEVVVRGRKVVLSQSSEEQEAVE